MNIERESRNYYTSTTGARGWWGSIQLAYINWGRVVRSYRYAFPAEVVTPRSDSFCTAAGRGATTVRGEGGIIIHSSDVMNLRAAMAIPLYVETI